MNKADLVLGRNRAERRTDRKGVDGMIVEVIAFIAGTIVGVVLMCIVQVKQKDHQDDEEQMKYLKEWNNKHGNRGGD